MRSKLKIDTSGDDSPDDEEKTSFCDYDFPLGQEGTSNCTEGGGHELIYNEAMCKEAANQASAHIIANKFKISQDSLISDSPAVLEKDVHPKGCFMTNCSESTNGICYYFNGVGDWPEPPANDSTLRGTPVCSRPKYATGTRDKNGKDTGACPTEYIVVEFEKRCQTTASCLGEVPGTEFRIGAKNASKHKDFPSYCFIDSNRSATDTKGQVGFGANKVYFNFESPVTKPEHGGWGAHPKGTPLCQVHKSTFFNTAGENVGVFHDQEHNAASNKMHYSNTNATAKNDTHGVLSGKTA
jgi:hypothetical protein